MAGPPNEGNRGEPVPTEKNIEELYDLIEGIEVAMFTTRRPDGHLVSRPMQTQRRTEGADLWFATNLESHKLDELAFDPHVNVAYYRDRTREWVSVSGTARVSQDRALIRELWEPSWRAWFPPEGGARDGTAEDPRIALILVDANSVIYSSSGISGPAVLFETVKGIVTGEGADVPEVREISGEELRKGRAA